MNLTPSQFKITTPVRHFNCEPDVFVKRCDIHPNLLVGEANTFGWDLVNVVRLPVANQSMREYPTPPPFTFMVQENWEITGDFDYWSIQRGGSGSFVFMNVPLKYSSMNFGSQISLDLKNIVAVIQVKLKYVPTPPDGYGRKKPDEIGELQYLTVNSISRSVDDPAVILQRVNFGKSTPTELEEALYKSALLAYFQANIHLFTYVFAIATVNAVASAEIFQWLKSTSTSYAYANGDTDETSYLAVLSMTQGRSQSGLGNQLSTALVPPRSNASLVISNHLFLECLVLPALPKAISTASESSFVLNGSNSIIENRSSVQLPDINVDSNTYQPILDKFVFQLIGDEIQIYSKVRTNVKQGLDVFVECTNFYRIRLIKSSKGGLTLDFMESRKARVNSWTAKSSGTIMVLRELMWRKPHIVFYVD
jgi:hypothetical protein